MESKSSVSNVDWDHVLTHSQVMCSEHDEPITLCFEKHHTPEDAFIYKLHAPCGHLIDVPNKNKVSIMECPVGHKWECRWDFKNSEWCLRIC